MNTNSKENQSQKMNSETDEKLDKKDVSLSEITGEETMGELLDIYESSLKKFEEGQVVTGTVISIGRDTVLVDVGYKSEGQISIHEFIDEKGTVTQVRARLTLLGMTREHQFPEEVLLSRSRYIAPANNSLRFYREYFKPKSETEIEKDRMRYLVRYKDTDFFINIDRMVRPEIGNFLEIKSSTWSKEDADTKSKLVLELIEYLGAGTKETVTLDYIDLVEHKKK